MAQGEALNSKADERTTGTRVADGKSCMTRRQFCWRNNMSEGHYYKLKRLGFGPREMLSLNKVHITFDAERDWQIACEQRAMTAKEVA